MAVSMEFIENFKQYTKTKKKLAEQFSVSEKTIQKLVDELIKISISSGGVVSESYCLKIASDPKSSMYSMFDWTETEQQRLEKADALLDLLKIVFSSDNKIFKILHIE